MWQCGGEGPEFGYDCEGNCVTGENLFIQMNDSYGDGWNGNTLVISGIAEITLDAVVLELKTYVAILHRLY